MAAPNPCSGYDYEFVSGPPKHLECSICLLTLRDAHVTSCCGNHFCQLCIGRIRNERKPCPLCNENRFTTLLHKGIVREVKSLKIRCPQREVGCDWEGELGQVEQHLNPREGSREQGCGFVLVECNHKCGQRLARVLVRSHELKYCPRRPTAEDPVARLADKLDTILAHNIAIQAEFDMMKHEIKAMKSENSKLRAENQTAKEKISQLQSRCDLLESHLTPVPPFNFTIYNTEHLLKADLVWVSPHFYSHPGGYKMRVLVYLNGYGSGYDTHLSLGVAIMRGEHDDQLQWPFQGKVYIQMFNRESQGWDLEGIVMFNKAVLDSKHKPPPECISNGPWWRYKFVSHQDLWEYVSSTKFDFIRFRVIRVEF